MRTIQRQEQDYEQGTIKSEARNDQITKRQARNTKRQKPSKRQLKIRPIQIQKTIKRQSTTIKIQQKDNQTTNKRQSREKHETTK